MNRLILATRSALIGLLVLIPAALSAQPFATGLKAPSRMVFTPRGNLLVSESGTGANDGRISFVNRVTGARRTVVDGLPAALTLGPDAAPSGPSGMAILNGTLYLAIGEGDATMPGTVRGTDLKNPSPSSPLLSSVLSIQSATPLDDLTSSFSLSMADQATIAGGSAVMLSGALGQSITIGLVVDFPDTQPAPTTDEPNAVQASDPYGLAAFGSQLYVADASLNEIRQINLSNGVSSVFAVFPQIANPTNVGPAMIDAVPDNIRATSNRLWVTFLTGFPFPPGAASVDSIDPATAISQQIVGNLSSAIDAFPVTGGSLVLEFSTDQSNNAPGRILFIPADSGSPTIVADNLTSPTEMAFDPLSGDLFVSEIFPGVIVRVSASGVVPLETPAAIIPVVADVRGALGSSFKTAVSLSNASHSRISGTLVFHPAGQVADPTDRALLYSLEPTQTITFPDVLEAALGPDIASVDVITTTGPAASVRVAMTSDGGCGGESTFLIPVVATSTALGAGDTGVLFTPADTSTSRMNIGVRTFDMPTNITATTRTADGTELRKVSINYPAGWFGQVSAADLVNTDIPDGGSIRFDVITGSAVIYGATTNNSSEQAFVEIATAVH